MEIYKITTPLEWLGAEKGGYYPGSADDIRDGFIHFSTRVQLPRTIAKHFVGEEDLVLLALDSEELGDALRWESSRDGELFPHLFGDLPLHLARCLGRFDPKDAGSWQKLLPPE